MTEADLWRYVQHGMGPLWEAERIENRLNSGTPDVSYSTNVHGWMELKYLPAAPKKDSTVMQVRHFTPEQRNWITRHGRRTGLVFVFMRIASTFMLFDWSKAREIGTVTFDGHKKMAVKMWESAVDWDEFADLISKRVL